MKVVALLETADGKGLCVEKFNDYPQLGRFTLRDEGRTVAIGRVSRGRSPFLRIGEDEDQPRMGFC